MLKADFPFIYKTCTAPALQKYLYTIVRLTPEQHCELDMCCLGL